MPCSCLMAGEGRHRRSQTIPRSATAAQIYHPGILRAECPQIAFEHFGYRVFEHGPQFVPSFPECCTLAAGKGRETAIKHPYRLLGQFVQYFLLLHKCKVTKKTAPSKGAAITSGEDSRFGSTIYFTFSTTALKASGLFRAKSASTLRLSSIPAFFKRPISTE